MKQIHLILLMFFLLISGCAQRITAPQSVQGDWKQALQAKKNWRASGKVAFISPNERQSANFNWRLKQDKQHLVLSSFIGTQLLELIEHDNYSELDYQDKQYQDVSSSELVKQLSGFDMPIDQAPSWLTGTFSGSDSEVDNNNRTKSARWVDEQGQLWQASYKQFKQIQGMWLPTRMELTHQDLKLKIQISSWQFQND